MQPEPDIIEWRPIAGYPAYAGLYEVSEHGTIRRVGGTPYCRQTRVLRAWPCGPPGRHRLLVTLSDKGIHCAVMVHQLVAWAFIGPPPYTAEGELMQIDHVDGNTLNNDYRNLEYVTLQENHHRATVMGLKPSGERHGRRKLTAEQVRMIREMAMPKWMAAEIFGIHPTQVANIRRYRRWKHVP